MKRRSDKRRKACVESVASVNGRKSKICRTVDNLRTVMSDGLLAKGLSYTDFAVLDTVLHMTQGPTAIIHVLDRECQGPEKAENTLMCVNRRRAPVCGCSVHRLINQRRIWAIAWWTLHTKGRVWGHVSAHLQSSHLLEIKFAPQESPQIL